MVLSGSHYLVGKDIQDLRRLWSCLAALKRYWRGCSHHDHLQLFVLSIAHHHLAKPGCHVTDIHTGQSRRNGDLSVCVALHEVSLSHPKGCLQMHTHLLCMQRITTCLEHSRCALHSIVWVYKLNGNAWVARLLNKRPKQLSVWAHTRWWMPKMLHASMECFRKEDTMHLQSCVDVWAWRTSNWRSG
jgi:hypothetical protein